MDRIDQEYKRWLILRARLRQHGVYPRYRAFCERTFDYCPPLVLEDLPPPPTQHAEALAAIDFHRHAMLAFNELEPDYYLLDGSVHQIRFVSWDGDFNHKTLKLGDIPQLLFDRDTELEVLRSRADLAGLLSAVVSFLGGVLAASATSTLLDSWPYVSYLIGLLTAFLAFQVIRHLEKRPVRARERRIAHALLRARTALARLPIHDNAR